MCTTLTGKNKLYAAALLIKCSLQDYVNTSSVKGTFLYASAAGAYYCCSFVFPLRINIMIKLTEIETIILPVKRNPALQKDHAILFADEPGIPVQPVVAKPFGITDLWKIHSGKRYVNVYPSRV